MDFVLGVLLEDTGPPCVYGHAPGTALLRN